MSPLAEPSVIPLRSTLWFLGTNWMSTFDQIAEQYWAATGKAPGV
jgi:hypothetical protein